MHELPLVQICGSCSSTIGTYPRLTAGKGKVHYTDEIPKRRCPCCGAEFASTFKLEITPVG